MAPIENLRRKADVVFTRARIAVFMDGCYWHGCRDHATAPKANRGWWAAKLDATRARDRDTDARLASAGWHVIRAWEHEDPAVVAERVERQVRATRQRSRDAGGGPGRTPAAVGRDAR